MIDIKIGNKTIQKAGIIYISPDGNDNNSGTKESPVKTYKKAYNLCGNNHAIFFMKGTHIFNFSDTGFVFFKNGSSKKTMVFSNPLETKIIWNVSHETYYSNTQFIYANGSDSIFTIYNLNIEITANLNSATSSYFHFLQGNNKDITDINITNCLIKCNVYNPYQSYSWGNFIINNSIIYLNAKESDKYARYTFNNSIVYNLKYESKTNNNSSELEVTGSNFETIEKEAKALCTDTMGIYSGDYSEWIQAMKNYILYINNKYNYIEDNELKELNSVQDAYDSTNSYKLDDIKNNLSLLDKLKYIIIRFIKTVKY